MKFLGYRRPDGKVGDRNHVVILPTVLCSSEVGNAIAQKVKDIISIHCPLNESTRHLIGEREFKKMEKKPLLINTSRGPIIDEKALIQALKEGLVSGAGLDVLEKEPPDSQNPLLKMENVVLSPHIGFYSEESISELKRRTAKNVSDVLMGRGPDSVVNRKVLGKTRASISDRYPSS